MPDYDDSSKQLSLVHQAVVGDDAHTTELRHSDNPPHVPELSEDSGLPRPSSKADRLEFFLPISGFVWLYPEERAVVDHPAFQRLARIYQLGQSYFVFRGATHKRFEHVLGAVHVVQRMISAVGMNAEKLEKEASPFYAPKLSDYEERFVRLGTLLHDIGHIAAGHTVEDELGLVSKHDEDERLNIVINNSLNIKWLADSHGRSLGQLIDEEYALWTQKSGLEHAGFSASTLVRLLIRKPAKDSDIYSEIESYIMASDKFRLSSCRDMIGNTICADILDYIYRDWYHVGKPRPFDDRLLQYMELRRARTANPRFRTDIEADDQFVIFLGKPPKIRSDAVSHILELLEWRYSLAEIVLFHRTKLAAAAMLDRAFYELWGDGPGENEIIKFFLPLSDEEMLSKCYELAKERISKAKAADDKDRYQAAVFV
jgi:HD superfamily phosphohydrolase